MKGRSSGVNKTPPSPRTASLISSLPAGRGQRRRMKLHVLGVCDSSAGAMGHRQTVTASAHRIRRVAIDPAETTSR